MKLRTKGEIHNQTLDEYPYRYLKANEEYEVIGIDDQYFRIIDEGGHPALYPKYLFDVIDPTIPATWVRRDYPDGEYHIDPPELSPPYFDYDDYFDGGGNCEVQAKAQKIFAQFVAIYKLRSPKNVDIDI